MTILERFDAMERFAPVDQELDARGLRCPLPLLKAKQAINDLESGATLRVVATDPGSVRDFQLWSSQSGHELLSFTEKKAGDAGEDNHLFIYILRKRS
jgi:tRNA 2-thiouridine synthesizing protein A